jgi:hypothetical protein
VTEAAVWGHLARKDLLSGRGQPTPGPIQLASVTEFQQSISADHSLVRTRIVRRIGYMAPYGTTGQSPTPTITSAPHEQWIVNQVRDVSDM